MGLPGINNQEEVDFPRHVKDSVTVLPFFIGGETTLAITDIDETLVKVSELRRFENLVGFATGAHTGGNNSATTLTDSAGDFIDKGVEPGDTVTNTTDGSSVWNVVSVDSATQLTLSLTTTGGGDDDFDTSDAYTIDKTTSHVDARAAEVRQIRIITDLDIYLRIDGDASAASHTIRINAGESISESNIRAVSRLSFINVTNPETPKVRWWVYGV